MELNLNNEIDKKISCLFTKNVIANIKPRINEYLGMNLSSDIDTDIEFKIYYEDCYSRELYEQEKSDPFINFLYEKNMVSFLEIVHDRENETTRFNIGLQNRNNTNMTELFSWLGNNISFYDKYKDEIFNFSKLKNSRFEGYDYAALFFIGFIKDKFGKIKVLKLYWQNKYSEQREYYINFIQNSNIKPLQELMLLTTLALNNCGGNLYMEGIDYNEQCSEKHKIYIDYPTNLYDGLLKTFSDNEKLKREIKLVRNWHELHDEFSCSGFALCKDPKDNLIINMYFKLKENIDD